LAENAFLSHMGGTASIVDVVVQSFLRPAMQIRFLADVPEAIGPLSSAFKQQWSPDKPESHTAVIASKFQALQQRHSAPLALVATEGNEICGTASLLLHSVHSRPTLGPWLGALYVFPSWRCQGLGAALVGAIEAQAANLGIGGLYAGSATAASLFRR